MKLETISLNILRHSLNHGTSSGVTKMELEKKNIFPATMKYIEDYCTKNGFEIINVSVEGNIYIYHLMKK